MAEILLGAPSTPVVSPGENIFSRLFGETNKSLQEVLDAPLNSPEEALLFMIYIGKISQTNDENKMKFFQRHSYARDEWCMKISAIHSFIPYNKPDFFRELYNNEKVIRWSNGDDLSFYEYQGNYLGRKFRIIFYHSCDYTRNGEKKPFDNLLAEDTFIRICWY